MGHSNWFFFGGLSVSVIPNDICAEVLCIHAIVASVYFCTHFPSSMDYDSLKDAQTDLGTGAVIVIVTAIAEFRSANGSVGFGGPWLALLMRLLPFLITWGSGFLKLHPLVLHT